MKSAQPTIDYLDQPTSTARRGGLSALRYPVYVCSGLAWIIHDDFGEL
ncbi:MAG: hypothetical protein ACKO4L_12525 [Nodosilinea sp.]